MSKRKKKQKSPSLEVLDRAVFGVMVNNLMVRAQKTPPVGYRVKKKTVPMGENSCMCNYFPDGKHGMGNFNIPDLHRFS